ncbi:molybdopterin-dependent oxidoreductase [Streptomyces oceani]|uniref:Molybdopterin-binding oxidoreductase n=1 Tax=Streptomyces oceani TaxID=1075402 RepID=A0A1E7KK07_9ACTN|nr:molybdopterin-dependent oxidoreductase [Streptomyces oceani]OEV04177.1 molybdopterin-binding oxidoreductase [Streptomyces oceani]
MPSRAGRLLRLTLGGFSGVLAGGCALGVAELAAAFVGEQAGPVTAVGGAVIDRTPTPVKVWAVQTFGTDDKLVLRLGILLTLTLFALALGMTALRHRRVGAAGVLVFGLIGAGAAASRPMARWIDVLPSLGAAALGAIVLYVLTGQLTSGGRHLGAGAEALTEGPAGPASSAAAEDESGAVGTQPTAAGTESTAGTPPYGAAGSFDRRGFVLTAGAVGVASAASGWFGRRLDLTSADAVAAREAVTLPAPGSRAAPVPSGVHPRVRGLSPFFTANRDFYRVDTALAVPKVDPDGWRLRLHGKGVSEPRTFGFRELLERDLIERDITLTCVSNEVGGEYVSTARWLGVPLGPLLRAAGVRPPSEGGPADQLVARSVDGMTLGSPVEVVLDGRDAMLAVGMNGQPLPFRHGFPVRMLVPGLYGYVSACKWLQELELTTFRDYDTYWTKRDWAARAPVKTQSRIDTPKPFDNPKAGTVPVAGVAWAQHTGIERVEVRVDDGAWQRAELAPVPSQDTWRQWVWQWPATPGSHTLQVRATDRDGNTQTARRAGTVPDGATGRHQVVVDVR